MTQSCDIILHTFLKVGAAVSCSALPYSRPRPLLPNQHRAPMPCTPMHRYHARPSLPIVPDTNPSPVEPIRNRTTRYCCLGMWVTAGHLQRWGRGSLWLKGLEGEGRNYGSKKCLESKYLTRLKIFHFRAKLNSLETFGHTGLICLRAKLDLRLIFLLVSQHWFLEQRIENIHEMLSPHDLNFNYFVFFSISCVECIKQFFCHQRSNTKARFEQRKQRIEKEAIL